MAFSALTTEQVNADSPLDTTLMLQIKDNLDDLDSRVAAFKVGSFTRETSVATGTQAVTGVGFVPRAIMFFSADDDTTESSWGIDDDVTAGVLYDNSQVSVHTYRAGAVSIFLQHSTGDNYSATINSFDGDGFTLSWIKTGIPTGTAQIRYLAFS
jgi:hypothetical protein